MHLFLTQICSSFSCWAVLYFVISFTSVASYAQSAKNKHEWMALGLAYEENREWLSALQCYEEVLKKEPAHYEATWRAAVACSQSAYLFKEKEEKKIHLDRGVLHADKAMRLYPHAYTSHYARVMILGSTMALAGNNVLRMLEIGKKVRVHLDAALAVNPKHAESLAIMASMQIRLGSLNYVERLMVGDLAKDMSVEQGLAYSRKALALKPAEVRFYILAAEASNKLNKKAEAKEYLQKALQLHPRHADDEKWMAKCREMLNELDKT